MRNQVFGVTVFAAAILFFAALLFPAPAQQISKIEYKAVSFAGSDEKESTRKLNELAQGGWEYVGPLGNGLIAFRKASKSGSDPIKPVVAENKFRIDTPKVAVKQKDKAEAYFKILWDKVPGPEGKEIEITFSNLPKGINVFPDKLKIKPGEKEFRVTVETNFDVKEGIYKASVTGTSENAGKASADFAIEVLK